MMRVEGWPADLDRLAMADIRGVLRPKVPKLPRTRRIFLTPEESRSRKLARYRRYYAEQVATSEGRQIMRDKWRRIKQEAKSHQTTSTDSRGRPEEMNMRRGAE